MHSAHKGLTHVMAPQKFTKGSPSCQMQAQSISLVDSLDVLMLAVFEERMQGGCVGLLVQILCDVIKLQGCGVVTLLKKQRIKFKHHTMEKFKQIQNRLNNLTIQEQQGPNKIKIKQLQTMIGRLTGSLEEDDITREYKLNELLEKVRKIQTFLKDTDQEMSIKEAAMESTVNRVEKGMKKKLQKFQKMKKQADKDFQSSLSNYLIELAGFKSKMNHSCLNSIAMLKQKQAEIQQMAKSHTENTLLTKQIVKKISQQYTGQIEEIGRSIIQEQQQRKLQEEILLERLEKMYEKMSREVKEIKKERERSEGEMIGLLEKVVERVRTEVVKM